MKTNQVIRKNNLIWFSKELQLIECEQQDFSTACMEGLSWSWDESMGIKIYTEQEGCKLYMLIYRNGGTDF